MKCSVFIATSMDGFIAKPDGSVDWLQSSGNLNADMSGQEDMGFNKFIASVDCIVMGRKCMEVVSAMNLSAEQWPYGNLRIIVLSNSLKHLPQNMQEKAELYSGDLKDLLSALETKGFNHAYVDGGTTIRSFMEHRLIDEITITRAPILLGEGIPLFGITKQKISLSKAKAIVFPNDYIQVKFGINYLD